MNWMTYSGRQVWLALTLQRHGATVWNHPSSVFGSEEKSAKV